MKFSQLLIPTLKEAPNEATLPSHIYLLRGGFIQSVGSGLYNFLPLGKRSLDRVQKVIKEELDKAGAQEVSLSFVTPASFWIESGRFEKYGKELLRFKDRKDSDFVLGPTHEEMMVNLVKQTVKSYKQLPLNLYQINLKFRDEIRPRFGLMRGREFLMKDGYSFHANEADMKREFDLMEATYKKIFTRLGLDFRVVEADSGAIGGSGSKEFMVLADSGEDTIVVCENCQYGANIEAAIRQPKEFAYDTNSEFKKVHTPNTTTIEEVSKFLDISADYIMKTVAKKALYDGGRSEIVLFVIRGSDTLEETKACNAVCANEIVDISDKELFDAGLVAGYMGPLNTPKNIRIVVDDSLKDASGMVSGANEADCHLVGASSDQIENPLYKDIVAVQENDRCSCCGGRLYYTKGIEVGHIFQLGTRYSEPLKAEFLNEQGKTQPFVMGTYGIGVSRLLAAIIEQHHDERGCMWTKESSPFDLVIIVSNIKDELQSKVGQELYSKLSEMGVAVLLDDRKERFGFKMKDFELIGIPCTVVVGQKLHEGKVEIVMRQNLQPQEIATKDVVTRLKEEFKW
ncbi:MAG TPA: proline--tRNA ligase [Epsilonproteobacteria bacterium]|nr:proline--tRNA ligase [Campylobacterota bacterium]